MSTKTDALIEQLRSIALNLRHSDALVIKTAIDVIRDLEDRLSDYEEDITDWQNSVMSQMGRGARNDKL